MGEDFFAQIRGPVNDVLNDVFFSSDELTEVITLKRYTGRNSETNEKTYSSFTIRAIIQAHLHKSNPLYEALNAESGRRHYTIRETDLPTGVTRDDLGPSWRGSHEDGTEFAVIEVVKNPGFILEFVAQGAG